jgi:hypothetical protein
VTGTTGTGDEPKLTPLNLMLVTIRLPDEPVVEPEPEPAEAFFDLQDGLVDYWTLDEGTGIEGLGTITTGLNGGIAGPFANVDFTSTAKIGDAAIQITGQPPSANTNLPHTTLTTPPWTISAWWRESGVETSPAPICTAINQGEDGSPVFSVALGVSPGSNQIRAILRNNSIPQEVTLNAPRPVLGTWVYVVLVYDAGGVARLYVDGQLAASTTSAPLSLTAFGPTEAARFIRFFGSFNNNLIGQIDEVGFWGRILSADEIEFLYNNGAGNRP